MLERVRQLTSRITMNLMGITFSFRVEPDQTVEHYRTNPRVFLQVEYIAPCTKSGEDQTWRGRKWYLSEYMTDDEIVKTAWCAFEAAVKHEVMEGFRVDGIVLFNPHVNYEELLRVSHLEVQRVHKTVIN